MMPLVSCVACDGALWIDPIEGSEVVCWCGRSRVSIESGDLVLRGPCVVTWLPDDHERIPIARAPAKPLL
ncbi:MAG TPA: hypothetical protein VIE12_11510 [Actinomycetota bacterium]|jgi:hypothetical protein